MAPPQRRAQKPRGLFVPAGTAPPRVAPRGDRPAAAIPPSAPGETRPRTGPIAELADGSPGSVPAHSTTTDPQRGPATPLSPISRRLSLPRLPPSLRSTPAP